MSEKLHKQKTKICEDLNNMKIVHELSTHMTLSSQAP